MPYANGLITFSINRKWLLLMDVEVYQEIYLNCIILAVCVFDNIISADELFAKDLQSFKLDF